jgi:anti-sigma factor RsiW
MADALPSTGSGRRDRACEALSEQRSALVDGALNDADRERVLTHLVGCAACRAEVAELRRLRRLLSSGATPDASPSDELADRLVAIAGSDAREPLLAAPFRQTAAGSLRRGRRLAARTVATAGTLGAGAVLVVAVGLAAAPPMAATIADPTVGAQAEFSALSAQLPLADSAGSVVMGSGQVLAASLSTSGAQSMGPSATLIGTQELDSDAALAVLRRAATSAAQISYRGSQVFQVLSDGQLLSAQLTVETRLGNGREVAVYDASGRMLSSIAAGTPSRVVDSDELSLLADNYLLGASRGAEVAGRSATVVSAYRPSGQTAARWWVDDDSGLLLWHATYDTSGRTTISAGFTSVQVGQPDTVGHASVGATVPLTNTSLTLASTGSLVTRGWLCPDDLAGLSLVRLRTDSADDPTVVHLAYSDGVSSVSVFEQHGTLAHAPSGAGWDADLKAYVRGGAAKVATWQSGTTVYTVVTDGSPDLLDSTIAALPHEVTPPRTTIDRVRAGWSRILESVTG